MMVAWKFWATVGLNAAAILIALACAVNAWVYLTLIPIGGTAWLLLAGLAAVCGFVLNFILYGKDGIDVFLKGELVAFFRKLKNGSRSDIALGVFSFLVSLGSAVTMFCFTWQSCISLGITLGMAFNPVIIAIMCSAFAVLTFSLIFTSLNFGKLWSAIQGLWAQVRAEPRKGVPLFIAFVLLALSTLWGAFSTCSTWFRDMLRFLSGDAKRPSIIAKVSACVSTVLVGFGEGFFTVKYTLGFVVAFKAMIAKMKTGAWWRKEGWRFGLYLMVIANAIGNAAIAFNGILPAIFAGLLSFVIMKQAVDGLKGIKEMFPREASVLGKVLVFIAIALLVALMVVLQLYFWSMMALLPMIISTVSIGILLVLMGVFQGVASYFVPFITGFVGEPAMHSLDSGEVENNNAIDSNRNQQIALDSNLPQGAKSIADDEDGSNDGPDLDECTV